MSTFWARVSAIVITVLGVALYSVTFALPVIDNYFTPEDVSDGMPGWVVAFGAVWFVVTTSAALFFVLQDRAKLIILSAIPGIFFWMPIMSMIMRQAKIEGAL